MGAGLRKSLVPVFVGGAIDTKSDPRLVEAGSLLELENLYMQRTGELRWRNGYTSKPKATGTGTITGAAAIFRMATGQLGILGATSAGRAVSTLDSSGVWRNSGAGDLVPYPSCTAKVDAGSDAHTTSNWAVVGGIPNDLACQDSSYGNGQVLTVFSDQVPSGFLFYRVSDYLTGATVVPTNVILLAQDRPGKAIFSGGRHCVVFLDTSATPSLKCLDITSAGTITTTTVVLNGVSAAQPWFDITIEPSSGRIAIAYRASGGGVSTLLFDVPSHTVAVGPVNTVGADASMTMGWVENHLTSSLILATAGSAAGVVARIINPGTLAVTTTTTIDATATTGVREITGFVWAVDPKYIIIWDKDATPTYLMTTSYGNWNGSAATVTTERSLGVVSRPFFVPLVAGDYASANGVWYLILSYDSTLQSAYFVSAVDPGTGGFVSTDRQAEIMYQYAGGRNALANTITSVWRTSTNTFGSALTRRGRSPTTSGTTTNSYRSVLAVNLAIENTPRRPREIGSTVFIPGGLLAQYDGHYTAIATMPAYPEAATCAGVTTGGSMTSGGSYDYVWLYKIIDSNGRAIRSAPSVPTTVVLGAGNDSVQVTLNLAIPLPNAGGVVVGFELYRRGPAASGASVFNKVRESISGTTPVNLFDTVSDLAAAAKEILYTTGGVLENFPPPSHSLLEVNAGRVWVVNAEDPTELWPSKEYKPGLGIGFHPLLAFRVTGDGYGPITALAAMDGRLIVFKSSAIYIIQGAGPDDTGGGGNFSDPQAVSLSIGTVLPGSVVHTPDGIMFQSSKGIYLLDRGFRLTYLGKQVEKYTLAENVVDASLVDNATQVRFVMASGRCLVWDYDLQRWYTFTLPVGTSTIVSCANISGGWCYALADGTVKQEVAGQYQDDGVAIVPRVTFPNIDTAGINGFQRVYAIQVLGEYVGDHTLTASIEYDYDGIAVPSGSKAITTGAYQYEIIPRQKCSAIKLTLSCTLLSGSGGFRLSGVSFLVGLKTGSNIPYTKRLT